ncbi:MAG: hypothetical protein KDD50_15530 [Bdellovibrionales bacterium]|nr:hypothetical protein [Bdellovibrionales bacterium]MCB9815025.1 hypothetical protein [Candidatus Nomurabacteria bacterium]
MKLVAPDDIQTLIKVRLEKWGQRLNNQLTRGIYDDYTFKCASEVNRWLIILYGTRLYYMEERNMIGFCQWCDGNSKPLVPQTGMCAECKAELDSMKRPAGVCNECRDDKKVLAKNSRFCEDCDQKLEEQMQSVRREG